MSSWGGSLWGIAGPEAHWARPAGPAGAIRPAVAAGGAQEAVAGEAGSSGGIGSAFLAELARALQQVEGLAGQADDMARRLVTGQVDDLSQVMIASEKARLAIELAVQLRNKALEAYQEIMRMPV